MDKKQLRIIFIWYLMGWIVAGGLLPLLPVHARQLGAEPAIVGYYIASAYVMLASGSLFAGWLSKRTQSRRRWIIAATAGVPIGVALMGWATDVWQLAAAGAIVWLCFGLIGPLADTLIGLRTKEGDRGRVFGTMGITMGLGALIGGATLGPAADRWGYGGMFLVAALFGAAFLLAALFIKDIQASVSEQTRGDEKTETHLGWRYWAFLGSLVMIAVGTSVGTLSRSLVMNDAGFGATAISSTGAITGLASLLVQPAVGWLSDRLSRRSILAAAFGAMALSLWLLSASTVLWQFWAVAVLLAISDGRNPLQKALITDMVEQESLGMGMAFLSVSAWVGGIVGFGVAGNALQALGARTTLLAAAGLSLPTMIALAWVRSRVAATAGESSADTPELDAGER